MIPLEIEEWLSGLQAARAIVAEKVDGAVRNYCNKHGFAYLSRPKDDQSVAEKFETGRIASLADFDDLFACSIIIPSLDREDRVLADIGAMFETHVVRRRHDSNKDPEVFRFEATRFIGRLKTSAADDSRLGQILFEIQIRSAFEHACAAATHLPAYKSHRIDWKLERLAAQMKALVEQLDMLAVAYHESAEVIVSHPCARTEAEEQVFEAFSSLIVDDAIPEECRPASMGRFAKNVVALARAANWGGRVDLKEQITRILNCVVPEIKAYGASRFPRSISLFQLVLGIVVERGLIRATFRRDDYFPPVSQALIDRFPSAKDIQPRCDLATLQSGPEPLSPPNAE